MKSSNSSGNDRIFYREKNTLIFRNKFAIKISRQKISSFLALFLYNSNDLS